MRKLLSVIAILALITQSSFAGGGGAVYLYDAAGNALSSTAGALNISGSISSTNPSVGATGSAVPAQAGYVAGSKAGILTGLLLGQQTMANSLACNLASDQSTLNVNLASSSLNLNVKDLVDGSITGGTAGTFSALMGGQFNTVLPTLTTGQQAALQTDASARIMLGTSTAAIGSVTQGTAAALAGGWPVIVTDGTNTMPTMDLKSRAGFQKLTDGTSIAAVKAASTAAIATDQALVVAVSPNNTIAATQSGTWTVQPGNTQNSTAWLVQDLADGTVAAGTAGTKSSLIGGIFNTVLPTLTTGQQSALQADSSGRLLVGSIASALPTGANTIGIVNQGTAATAANAWTAKITDGTNTAAVKAASTAAVASDPAMVVAISPNNTVAATQSGTWTVQPGNTANTTPWLTKLNDGVSNFTIKAASTAAVATDTAIVVAVSPNNTLSQNQVQVGGSAISLGSKTSANSYPVVIASDQGAIATKSPLNATASASATSSITTTPTSITAASNAVEVLVQASDANTANLRVSIGTTCSSTLGIQLQPGRLETFHTSQNLSVCSESGTQSVNVQWLAQ